MKTKILKVLIISFIFFVIYFPKVEYAETNEIKEYKGQICLDNPQENKSYIKSNDKILSIKGWAVSEDSEAKVRIKIDGNVITETARRSQRPDVDEIVSPQYGGKNVTLNAGFNYNYDISDLKAGWHVIKIEQYSRYGDVISAIERGFTIENKKYAGSMCIDQPTENKIYTKPKDDILNIKGWAVSEDSEAKVRIKIDGNVITENVRRSQRPDVDEIVSPQYGGKNVTLNAGFNYNYDISDLKAGWHVIKIEQYSRYGDVISAIERGFTIENKKYAGSMCIDQPTENKIYTKPKDDILNIKGWAVSEDSEAKVRIKIDGNVITETARRSQRPDVDEIVSPQYGGKNVTLNAGFNYNYDISDLKAGWHVIKIEQYSRYGDVISAIERGFTIENKKYAGSMCIDQPTENKIYTKPKDDILNIKGWAVSEDSEAKVRIKIDGNVITETARRSQRPDVDEIVSPQYGGKNVTLNAGFNYNYDISDLKAGWHVIKIEQYSRYGDVISAIERGFTIENKKYAGSMCIDQPTENKIYTKPKDDILNIKGWAVSEDSEAKVRIKIDGNVITETARRSQRPDVDEIVSPQYGGKNVTPNAGFELTCNNLNGLNSGRHVIRIEQYSRYGDIISVIERNFNLENPKYNGLMCIDSPGDNSQYRKGEISNIEVIGWAVSEDANSKLYTYLDGNLINNVQRVKREDVDVIISPSYGGTSVTPNAGFKANFNISSLSVGSHRIRIEEKSHYGDVISALEKTIIIISTNNNIQENIPNKTNDLSSLQSGTKVIDVSQHQGTIDWKKVANSGVKYAMIRIGYRGYGNGRIVEDSKFKYNIQNALNNGIKVGVYYYSPSINTNEAREDAEYIVNLLKKYGYSNSISLPIAIDLELVSGVNTRDINVSKTVRTNIANTFGDTISKYGYKPMVYACKSFLNDNINKNNIKYNIWVAQYNTRCTYSGNYAMWQYTSSESISGISTKVDCSIFYGYY